MSRALQLNNTWGPSTQGPRACTSSSFPETRVWYWVTFEGPPRETIHQILYLASHPSISPAPCTFLSPVRDISKVATIIRWTRTFTRLHRPETPVFNARVREQGEGGRVLLYLTLRMQIPRVQGDMISSASPQASRSSIVIRVSDQPFKDKEPGKM